MTDALLTALQRLRDQAIAQHFAAEADGDDVLAELLADVMVAVNAALDEVRGRAA